MGNSQPPAASRSAPVTVSEMEGLSNGPSSRIALVTGASSGIGREAALSLDATGWTVILTARSKPALEETVRLMGEDRAERTTIVVGDLSKPEFVEALFQIIQRDFGKAPLPCPRVQLTLVTGRLDLLFNVGQAQIQVYMADFKQNAGMPSPRVPFEDCPLDKFQDVFDLNVTSSYFCAQEAYKIMKAQSPQGGRSVSTSEYPC